MTECDPEVLVVVCLTAEDTPDEQLLARALVGLLQRQQPRLPVVLPYEARTEIWDDLGEACSGDTVDPACRGVDLVACRSLAVALGTAASEIAKAARRRGIDRLLLIGPDGGPLSERLTAFGFSVGRVSAAAARISSEAPALPVFGLAPDRAEARKATGLAEKDYVVLWPASVGIPDALAVVDRLAAEEIAPGPLHLVFCDRWDGRERLIQRAMVKGLRGTISFCGEVPLRLRATLVAAVDAVVCPRTFGAFEGHDAAFARRFGRRILRPDADLSGVIREFDPPVEKGGDGEAEAEGETRADNGLPEEAAAAWSAYLAVLGPLKPSAASESMPPARSRVSSSVVVVMPSYGCRTFLRDAISAVLCQSHQDTHLVVIDDSGSDVDADLMRDHGEVTFLRSPGKVGPFVVANQVITATQSDLVAFHDADDESHPDRLACQVEQLQVQRFDAIGTNSRIVDLHGGLLGVEVRPVDATLQMRALAADMLLHPSSLLRRSMLEELGGFDSSTRFGADTELHLRASLSYDIGNVSAFLYTRRQRPDSLTQSRSTGFGSDARVAYNQRIETAYRAALAGGRTRTEPGRTLYGATIPAPNIGALKLLSAGRGAERWLKPPLRH